MKYAIITGSTKGIGRSIAEMLLLKGYFVIVNYAKDDATAEGFLRDMSRYSDRLEIIKQELSSYSNVKKFIVSILKITQKIDCLVLNAGVTDRSEFREISQKNWEYTMNVNLNVPFYLVQGLEQNITTKFGRIIFIASILGKYPHASSLSYAVSKAGIIQLMHNLVKVFALREITVNAILPGFVDTPWQKNKPADLRQRIEDKIALNRFALPNEIADLCWQVITNGYINGSELVIDGGYSFK